MDIREALISAGQHIELDVRRQVLELGERALTPLLAVFEDEDLRAADGPGDGWAPVHAAHLLGDLGDPRAVPALLAEFAHDDCDSYLYNAAALALPKFGEAALQPLLAHYDACDDPQQRNYAASLLADLGVREPRIYAALCAGLGADPGLIAGAMVRYGDTRALPALQGALDSLGIEDDLPGMVAMAARELSAAIVEFGGELSAAEREKVAALRTQAGALEQDAEALEARDMALRDSLLSAKERAAFERVFTGEGGLPSAWHARGFLVGVACSPSLNTPNLWLPALLPPPSSKAHAAAGLERAVGEVFAVFNTTLDALGQGDATYACPKADDAEAVGEFCRGFMACVEVDEAWDRTTEGAETLGMLASLARPRGAATAFEPGRREADLDRYIDTLYDALAPLRLAAAQRAAAKRAPVVAAPKVGRNAPCPCGSGKKYKRCCGRP